MVFTQTGSIANACDFSPLSAVLQLIANATPTFVAKLRLGVQKVDNLPYQIARYRRDGELKEMPSRI